MRIFVLLLAIGFASCSASPRRPTGVSARPDGTSATAQVENGSADVASATSREQYSGRKERDVETRDRDGDGSPEILTSIYDGGSGFGGTTCVLEEPSSGGRWEAATFGSFGTMVGAAAEPEGMPNEALRDALMECVTGPKSEVHPSLDWWLRAMENHHRMPDVNTWSVRYRWVEGAPTEPKISGHRVPVDAVTPAMREISSEFGSGLDEGPIWLVYFGHNHAKLRSDQQKPFFRQVAASGQKELLATRHGLVLRKRNEHAWIFVSDERWGGPDKLRFDSVTAAGFVDGSTVWMIQRNVNGRGAGSLDAFTIWFLRDGAQVAFNLSDLEWTRGGEALDGPVEVSPEDLGVRMRGADVHVVLRSDPPARTIIQADQLSRQDDPL